jgi:hypothetical protein
VGQFLAVPQPPAITNNAVRRIVSRILDLIESPPNNFPSNQASPGPVPNQIREPQA